MRSSSAESAGRAPRQSSAERRRKEDIFGLQDTRFQPRDEIQRRDAESAEESAELMPRRRRGGMGWEILAGVSPAVARRVGQAIALCGLSCFAVSRQADRRQKAIVCPTGSTQNQRVAGGFRERIQKTVRGALGLAG